MLLCGAHEWSTVLQTSQLHQYVIQLSLSRVTKNFEVVNKKLPPCSYKSNHYSLFSPILYTKLNSFTSYNSDRSTWRPYNFLHIHWYTLSTSKHASQSRSNVTAPSMQHSLFRVVFHQGVVWSRFFPFKPRRWNNQKSTLCHRKTSIFRWKETSQYEAPSGPERFHQQLFCLDTRDQK